MNLSRKFRFAHLATLVIAMSLPALAVKPPPDSSNDCNDTVTGTMSVAGTLAVTSTSKLSACATKTELQGTVSCTFSSADGRVPGKPRPGEIVLTKIAIQSTTADGEISTSSAVSGTLTLLDCTADGACKPGLTLDIAGTVASDGQLVAAFASKKGYDYYKAQSDMATAMGTLTSNDKEGTISAKGSYIGHITIIK